jgi:hypothetical protein
MAADMPPGPRPYPAAGDWPPNAGPGAPTITFTDDQLDTPCSYLDGGEEDRDHHNLVVMWDGYLMMPWAQDLGKGGVTFFDISDPCAPVTVGSHFTDEMRETHSVGIAQYDDRVWATTAHIRTIVEGGVLFWDITDPAAPEPVSETLVDGFLFPDAYRRVTLSTFWQVPYVYVGAAQNGVVVIDATDPEDAEAVGAYVPEPVAQIGQVQVIGNLLVATTAEGSRALLLDISDPADPQPIPGGDFQSVDDEGMPREAYFTNTTGGYLYFARKDGGGGLMIYDIRDPTNPTRVGGINSSGNGGYVFVQDDVAFVGEGSFASLYDVSDPSTPTLMKELELEGDLDTITPIGNLAVLSVDDDAVDGQGTSVVPWRAEPDTTGPHVTWSVPDDGADDLAVTSRVGVTFNEFVDPKSAWEGSVRLYEADRPPEMGRVDGWISAQETIVNFWPKHPLKSQTRYVFEIPAGGVADYAGNRLEDGFRIEFETR